LSVGDWSSNWDCKPPAPTLTRPKSHVHGCLGWAVEVVQLGVRQFEETFLQREWECFTATDHSLQRATAANLGLVQKQLQHRGDEVHRRHLLGSDKLCQISRVLVSSGSRNHQACANH